MDKCVNCGSTNVEFSSYLNGIQAHLHCLDCGTDHFLHNRIKVVHYGEEYVNKFKTMYHKHIKKIQEDQRLKDLEIKELMSEKYAA